MTSDPSIFKAYDIRGIVGSALTLELAYSLGRAYATHALAQSLTKVAVGRDGRLSGASLRDELVRGLTDGGVDVLDIGMVTTPMLYFTCATTAYTSGIMITGSHNPANYNGFKMVMAGNAIYGDAIQALRHTIEAGAFATVTATGTGEIKLGSIVDSYIERIVSDVKLARPMKVIVDAGNGVGGAFAGSLLRALGCEVRELFCEVDGSFPNHHPDPAKPENLADLIRTLQQTDAEIGLALDGDADRLGVVTKDGQIIYPDRQLMLYAQDVLGRHPGGTVVFDVKCSANLAPAIAAAGGKPLMYKTGHSLIKAKMREVGSPLAGEMSGHIFWKDRWFGFDDGLYTAARLLEIVSRSADPSAVLNALPQSIATPEINLPCAEGEQHRICAALQQLDLPVTFPLAHHVYTIDGVRAEYAGGFGLARASNTTPVVVCRFEAQNVDDLRKYATEMSAAIQSVALTTPDITLPIWQNDLLITPA